MNSLSLLIDKKFDCLKNQEIEDALLFTKNELTHTQEQLEDYYKKYKTQLTKQSCLLKSNEISKKLFGTKWYLSQKREGLECCVFFKEQKVYALTSCGNFITDLPCLYSLERLLHNSVILCGYILGVLCLSTEEDYNAHAKNVLRALEDPILKFKIILVLQDSDIGNNYEYRWRYIQQKILYKNDAICSQNQKGLYNTQIFESKNYEHKTSLVCIQSMYKTTSLEDIEQIYKTNVEKGNWNGVVIRNEWNMIFTIAKPKILQAIIIGYTESNNTLCSLLFALREHTGAYRIIGQGSSSLLDGDVTHLYEQLSQQIVRSHYWFADSQKIAYQMVMPIFICTIQVMDILTDNSKGNTVFNPLLEFNSTKGYSCVGHYSGAMCTGITCISNLTTNSNLIAETSTTQISSKKIFNIAKNFIFDAQKKSMILFRTVYKRETKNHLYIKKIVIWETNKTYNKMYPSYVLHFTDYSSSRKNFLIKQVMSSHNKSELFKQAEYIQKTSIGSSWKKIL